MSTVRSRITDIAEAEYQAQQFDAVAAALNAPRHDIVDHEPGGYEKAETRLTREEIAAVLKALEAFARTDHADAGLIAHGLRKFSAGELDFAREESQEMFAALPTISGGAVSQQTADKLAAVGIRTESDADQINGGVLFTAADVQAVWDDEQEAKRKQELADYLTGKVQAVQTGIDNGTITDEAGVDAALAGGA